MVPTAKHLSNFFKEIVPDKTRIIVFDIETLPDKQKIETYYTKEELASRENPYQVSIGFHKVISFAYSVVELNKNLEITETSLITDLNNETNVLLDVSNLMNNHTKFVTFNGNSYDLPVLEKRSLYHGLNKSYKTNEQRLSLRNLVTKCQSLQTEPWNHLDLFHILSLRGQKGGLSFMCELIGTQKYDNLKGYQVKDLIESNDIETFKQYALKDAEVEAKLFIEVVNFFRK